MRIFTGEQLRKIERNQKRTSNECHTATISQTTVKEFITKNEKTCRIIL